MRFKNETDEARLREPEPEGIREYRMRLLDAAEKATTVKQLRDVVVELVKAMS